ncbi:small ribosomal subunit protein eS21-like [Clytia hemisphaerica]|uniref:small ribosomal subunit protein eS21-like n=1 Tax=Clytia hemisphaerica TaxID=252671 RepID=UPI0034D4FCEF
MQNDSGEVVDLYIPRKCSATNTLISSKDHASVQLSVAEVDDEGRMTGGFKTFAFSGKLRCAAESDDALNHLCLKDGIFPKNYNMN